MKITSLTVQNFLGVPDLRYALKSSMLFIAGLNGAGKSSLVDAIGFALTGTLPRDLKSASDRNAVISDGAKAGFVELVVDGYQIRRNVGSGKVTGDEPEQHHLLPFCLNAHRFVAMPEADRRRLLFELAGVKVDRQTVAEQLTTNDVPVDIAERVLPLLRDGFPAAAAFAKDQASQARGAWKATTGEAYGSQKAKTWRAPLPSEVPSDEEVASIRQSIAAGEARVSAMAVAKGRTEGGLSAERRAELHQQASLAGALQESVEAAEEVFAQAQAAVASLESAAQAGGTKFHCPSCEAELLISGHKVTLAPAGDIPAPAAHKKLDAARVALARAREELANCRTSLSKAQQAEAVLENSPEPSAEDLEAAANLDEERSRLQVHRNALRTCESSIQAAAVAEGRTKRAADEHAKVEIWTKVEDLLSPTGIPATLLARALDPVNDAIAQEATAVGWRPAQIERDLSITYGGRPYALCSESEQWRADALFTSLIAKQVGLLVIDRLDVLDPASRGEAIDWLERLSQQGICVVAAGTLKAKPNLGDNIDVLWMGQQETA